MIEPSGFAAFTALINLFNPLLNLVKNGKDIDAHNRVIEFQQVILKIQADYSELQNQNFILRDRVRELEYSLQLKGTVKFAHGAYWKVDDGPFCQLCRDSDGKLIRLLQLVSANGESITNDDLTMYSCSIHTSIRSGLPLRLKEYIKSDAIASLFKES